MRHPIAFVMAAAATALPASSASAWTRPGHMVAAAIAYDELMRDDPRLVAEMLRLLAAHPDPGPFQVAIDRSEGAERDRRLFLQMARWPDDIRGGSHDHPTWHYRLLPVADAGAAAPAALTKGSGVEALALNLSVARDPRASAADRAVALCWILHLVADFHQPLHSVERIDPAWPQGDEGGSKVFVRDQISGKPVSLHWFWDDSISRDGTAAAAFAKAKDLEARFPRARFTTELSRPIARADASRWLDESHDLAVTLAYRSDAPRATSPETATQPGLAYRRAVEQAAEQRLTLSGYRLADLLREILTDSVRPPDTPTDRQR